MKLKYLAAIAVVSTAFTATAQAGPVTVSVFDDPSYVDTFGGSGSESDTIQASLTSLGHTVLTFVGTGDAAWMGAFDGADVVLVPELENGSLAGALPASTIAAISGDVAAGQRLVVIGSAFSVGGQRMGDFLNTVFGFSLSESGLSTVTSSTLTAAAAGTEFAGEAPSLTNFSGTSALTGLPGGSTSIYESGGASTVAIMPFGAGDIVYIGWDWFDAAPLGSEDGGWLSVLDTAVMGGGSAVVPEPSSLALLGMGSLSLLGCGWRRKKKTEVQA